MISEYSDKIAFGSPAKQYFVKGEWFELTGSSLPLPITFGDGTQLTLFPGDLYEGKFDNFSINAALFNYTVSWTARIGINGTKPVKKGETVHRSLFADGVVLTTCGQGADTQVWTAGNLTLAGYGVREVISLMISCTAGNGIQLNSGYMSGTGQGAYLANQGQIIVPAGNDWHVYPSGANNPVVSVIPLCR